jgi:hypothetical protein
VYYTRVVVGFDDTKNRKPPGSHCMAGPEGTYLIRLFVDPEDRKGREDAVERENGLVVEKWRCELLTSDDDRFATCIVSGPRRLKRSRLVRKLTNVVF